MDLICRPATEEDVAKPVVVRRSCGGEQVLMPNRQKDYVLRCIWDYQERCGIENPLKRKMQGIDFIMPNRG